MIQSQLGMANIRKKASFFSKKPSLFGGGLHVNTIKSHA
jgi:hypothetical protein